MNEIVVAVPVQKQDNLIEAAKKGLYGELSDLSITMYDQAIDDFLSFVRGSDTTEFGNSLAVAFSSYLQYLRDKGYKPSTLNVKKAQIRRFFEWSMRVNWISSQDYHEIMQVKAPKAQGQKAGNWLTLQQMQQLLKAPDVSTCIGLRDRAVLALFMGCGLRRSEVVKLTWGHLTRYGDSWVIKNLTRKHHRTQDYIAVPDWVVQAIEQYSPRKADSERIIVSYDRHGNTRNGITTDALWRVVRHYADLLGFGNIAPHDLRRSFARAAKEKGISLEQLQLMLGHSSVATTEKYVNEIIQIEKLARAVELEI